MSASTVAWRRRGGFLLLSLLAGCATSLQSERVEQYAAGLPPTVELADVPFFPQEAYQCGPAALATALNWAGTTVAPEALVREVYLPERHGSLQLELLGAARRHGTVAYVLTPTLRTLLAEVAAGHPVIVLQNLAFAWYPKWHYAVVVGFDIARREIVLRSGADRRHTLALTTFERTWRRGDYWAMVALAPGRLPATAEELPYLQAATALERIGRATDARGAYEAALTRWPASLGALLGLGNARYALGDIAGAAQAFRRATAAHPEAAAAFNNLAHALMEQGRLDEAEQAAQHAVALGGPLRSSYRETLSEIKRRGTAAR